MSGNAKSLLFVMRNCVAAGRVSVNQVQSRSGLDLVQSRSGLDLVQSRSGLDLGTGTNITNITLVRYHNRWTAAPTPSLAGLSLRGHQDFIQRGLCSKAGTPQRDDDYPPLPGSSDPEPQTRAVYPPLPGSSEPEPQTREVYPPLPGSSDPEPQTREVYPPLPGSSDPEPQTREVYPPLPGNSDPEPQTREVYPPLPEYAEPEPQTREVYIVRAKGLPWSCTEEDLVHFFSECRVRDGVKGVHLTLNQAGKPSGQAFIEMEHEEDVSKALEKHRQYLGPRYVEVYEVTDFDAEAILKSSGQQPSQDGVVRLRGLPYSCTEADIRTFFSGLDVVDNGVTIVSNRRGRSSGEAYVQFASRETAEEAQQRDREVMGNRYIEVFASQRSEIPSSSQRWTEPAAAPAGRPPNPNPNPPPGRDGPAQTRPGLRPADGPAQHYVHMRGLPFQATAQDIVEFFSPLALSRVLIEYGPDGRPSGDAEAFFSCPEDAAAAMARDKAHMQKRYIELFLNSAPRR